MSREWKPGDVAMIPFARGDVRGMYTTDGWVCSDMHYPAVHGYSDLRPLVVIDPEDSEAVERHWRMAGQSLPSFRAALREYANPTPPRPDEPQGLGAVVEDADGVRWVRSERHDCAPWDRVGEPVGGFLWPDVAAVRVLSEGVA